jgi:hypothetical protein
MSALMLFSLILDSDTTYEPFFKKNLSEEVYVNASIEDWKNENIYKCPMQYEDKTIFILNDSEAVLVEQNSKH